MGPVGRVALSAAVVGLGLMTLGNLVEYWALSGFPHQGGAGAIARDRKSTRLNSSHG